MRRYLSTLYGNDALRKQLGSAIAEGRLPHALLLEGEAGSGKMTLALQIAAALECENRTSPHLPLPCGECRACRLVLSGNATDVTVIDKGERATLGVEAVREARADMFLSATELSRKIYIFKDAHTMTVGAQNALLVVLEEPPPDVVILLLTSAADAMLTTVRSRARTLRTERFSRAAIEEYLTEHRRMELLACDEDSREALLTAADGRIGEALRLLAPKEREELMREREVTDGILSAITAARFSAVCDATALLPTKREELCRALALLRLALRDLILIKKTEQPVLAYFTDAEYAREAAHRHRIGDLMRHADAISDAIAQLERNANVQTVLTLLKCSLVDEERK